MAFGTPAGRAVLQEWIVDQSKGAVTFSAHTGAPGPNGTANEVAGGSYARPAAPSWTMHATSKTVTLTNPVDITGMPAVGGSGVTHLGVWCGGTYFCDIDVTDQVVQAGNTLRINNTVSISA